MQNEPCAPNRPQASEALRAIDTVLRAARYLEQRGVESPRLSADLIVAHVLGLSRLELYLRYDRLLSDEDRAQCRELVRRRGLHEPMAYLLGHKEFFSLDFVVSPAVLIPRPETELLVESVLDWTRRTAHPSPRILDVGTGSGCIAIALLHALPTATAVGTDISQPALEMARQNALRHSVADRLALCLHDMEADWPQETTSSFDVLVSNPPYVSDHEHEHLMPDVRHYEPACALRSGPDPLRYYHALVRLGVRCVSPRGLLVVELGAGMAGAVGDLVGGTGAWESIAVKPDLSGTDRVLIAERKQGNVHSLSTAKDV